MADEWQDERAEMERWRDYQQAQYEYMMRRMAKELDAQVFNSIFSPRKSDAQVVEDFLGSL